jgi:hypothetical protein
VLGAQFGQRAHNVGTAVLRQGSWDHLKGASEGLVGPLHRTLDLGGLLVKAAGELHLESTTTGGEVGVNNDITGNAEGILKVTLDFVQDVLGGTAEDDGARVGLLALSHEGEVIITDFSDLEETAVIADIGLLKLLSSVDDRGASGTSDTVVIGLTDAAED